MINIFTKEKGTGALLDTRPEQEKAKDFHLDELVANLEPVQWVEKDDWKKYPIFDQNGSGSCVAQTVAKMLGIMHYEETGEYIHFNAAHVYQRRSNKPSGGMIGVNAMNIAREGVTLEAFAPCQSMTDKQMDAIKFKNWMIKVGEVFKAYNYVQLAVQDIDAIASTIQKTGKPVMVWYYFKHEEWTKNPFIKHRTLTPSAGSRHSVTAVDFFIKDGIKYLVIEDSWGTKHGAKGQRFISEEFHNKRNFFSAYFTRFEFSDEMITPRYTFTKTMKLGDRNQEVVALQDFLKSKGLFPINTQSTGYFGSVTKDAVIKFQTSVFLQADGIVGKNTLKELNK